MRQVRQLGIVSGSAVLVGVALSTPTVAEAHFKINMPMSWMSQDTVGGPQKNGPCAAVPNVGLGDSPGTATKMVTVFQSGQTVPISITATIAHPGWWRVALVEGPSSTQTLTTLPDPQAQRGTNCTPAIMTNPVWSPTQPIIADGLPAGSVATTLQSGTQTLQVKIPASASCTNARPCTLQVIMVMTDHPASDCYYHHCADVAVGTSTDGGSAPAPDASVPDDAAASGGGRGGGGTDPRGNSGGSSGTGGDAVRGTGGSSATAGGAGTGGGTGSGGRAAGTGGSSGSGGTIAAIGGSLGTTAGSATGGTGTMLAQPASGAGCSCHLGSVGQASWSLSAAGLLVFALTQRRRPRR